MSDNKATGSYYTPQRLADFIVYRLFSEGGYKFKQAISVLEPSVGDGIFLKSMLNGNYYSDTRKLFSSGNIPQLTIDAIEIDSIVSEETKKVFGNKSDATHVNVINQDGLDYFLNSESKYDLIIGNPPYVRRRNMSEDTQNKCAAVHLKAGMVDSKPKNLWTSFFVGAKMLLKPDGVIAFVLPTDLLQVKYAQEIREQIYKDFERVEIFSLNWIYFDDIEQDVVILICSNGHGTFRPRFCHINSLEDLEKPKHYEDYDNSQRTTLNKWTNYLLSASEFGLLDRMHSKIGLRQVREFCESGAGIVTAANDYFIVNKQTVEEYGLADISKVTIKKTSSMFPAVILSDDDISLKIKENTEMFLVDFPNKPKDELPKNYLNYISVGEQNNLHLRYKMLLRENWYSIPSVWKTEAFFTKRSNVFPRVILNQADAYVTDAFYRIRMKDDIDPRCFTFLFHNTLTFIYAELSGRYYGGGVLELTPNEFKDLLVPNSIARVYPRHLEELDALVRSGASLNDILNLVDNIVLIEGFGISPSQIARLRKIYLKLIRRRLKKSKFELS